MTESIDRTHIREENIEHLLDSLVAEDPLVRGFPVKLMIEPTNICNLKCPLCPTGAGTLARPKGMLSFENFCKVVNDLDPYLCNVVLWNYGESFINPAIYQMIRYAHDKQIETVCSTNGFPLHHNFPHDIENILESGLDKLIVCLDGATAQTHAVYRIGSDFNLLVKGLRYLIELRALRALTYPQIEIQFIAMRHNEHELTDIVKLSEAVGADQLSIKSVNLNMLIAPQTPTDVEQLTATFAGRAERFAPTMPELSRYDMEGHGRGSPSRGCARLWEMVVVNQDGEVAPCCYDVNAAMALGNAFQQDIKEIWNSPKYQALRRNVSISRRRVSLCSTCTDGAPTVLARLPISIAKTESGAN